MFRRTTSPSLPTDDAPRFRDARGGHVESWFVRANHPADHRAIWLKATVLIPDAGPAIAEAWCAVFTPYAATARKTTVPLDRAAFTGAMAGGDPVVIAIGECQFTLSASAGTCSGNIDGWSWDFAFAAVPSIGEPLCLFPTRKMLSGSFPRSKLVTPTPVARFKGSFVADGHVEMSGWLGMYGHNWGKEHALEYAWGQSIFQDAHGEPIAMMEGFSGRIRLGPITTPLLSALVVRRNGREYRFDRAFVPWRSRAEVRPRSWSARFRGRDGDAALTMACDDNEMVCLGYRNPDDRLSYCLNSKTARTVLRVNPVNDEGFECTSTTGALEFLRRTPDSSFPKPV